MIEYLDNIIFDWIFQTVATMKQLLASFKKKKKSCTLLTEMKSRCNSGDNLSTTFNVFDIGMHNKS